MRHASEERKRDSRRSGSGAGKAVGLGSVRLYDDKEGLEDVEVEARGSSRAETFCCPRVEGSVGSPRADRSRF